jgi:choline kinase
MVELNGRRLIDYTFDGLAAAGVERVVMVVGHGADEVRAYLGSWHRGRAVEYVFNADYAATNNAYSLLLAREALERDDSLLIESDVVFDPQTLTDCLAHPAPDVAVVAQFEPWMDGTVTLLDEQRSIARIVTREEFRWSERDHYFKTVNIYKFSRRFLVERFVPHLARHVQLRGRGDFYEVALGSLLLQGRDQLAALPLEGRRWYEIDTNRDFEAASSLFAETSMARASGQRRPV